jgi:hypothetical protein
MDDDDQPRQTLAVAGLRAYVAVHGKRGDQRVVLCRACGISSPPLAPGQEMDWFKEHAAEVSEDHRRAKFKR